MIGKCQWNGEKEGSVTPAPELMSVYNVVSTRENDLRNIKKSFGEILCYENSILNKAKVFMSFK